MKTKSLVAFLAIVLAEGILAEISLLAMRFESGRGHIFNYASFRLALAGGFFLVLAALLVFVIACLRSAKTAGLLSNWLHEKLGGPPKRLFFFQGALIIATIFLFEFFLLTFLVFPTPLRPFFIWAGLTTLQAWGFLRIAYADFYRQRPSLVASIRSKWNDWLPEQRKVFTILALIGLACFLAFIPFNYLRDSYGKFHLLPDEQVIYPDVIKVFAPQPNFAAVVQNVLGGWNWAYGYPYLPISAVVLIIPRLIFGSQFAAQVQVNIFLLRQFVSVLPMVLALMLAVYLVTRYKSRLASIGLFVFLLLVPGVVKINYRFWHPDSIILLLILGTFYFLQKDDLRFGRNFYFAALACGLTVAIKLWGLFFFLAIAGYLLAGLIRHKLTLGKLILSGTLFVLTMLGTVILTSPSLLAPYVARTALASWLDQQTKLVLNPAHTGPIGIYQTTLTNWLKYFGFHFMKAYFFFFACFAILAGSLWGSLKKLNRLLLAWCLPVVLFLAYVSTMKSFQYMLMVAIPLYCGAFLFPAITADTSYPKWLSFLAKPLARKIAWGITLAFFAGQLIVNLVILYLFVIRGR